MKQEYLLTNFADKDSLEKYNPAKIQKNIFCDMDKNVCSVQFVLSGENENVAKLLSNVDEYININYKVIVLTSDSSSYFNKRLYPLVSDFELKLRKLLYLASAFTSKTEIKNNIVDLEKREFGPLFSLLFVDDSFMSIVKNNIKNREKKSFSKAEVLEYIDSVEENTLWDKLLSKDTVISLRNNFNKVKEYRNDVMHSHYIRWNKFKEIQKLFDTINTDLDKAIEVNEVIKVSPTFNESLAKAIAIQENQNKITTILQPIIDEIKQQSKLYEIIPSSFDSLKPLQSVLSDVKNDISPSLRKLQGIADLYMPPAIIATEMQKLQNNLSFLDIMLNYPYFFHKNSNQNDNEISNNGNQEDNLENKQE